MFNNVIDALLSIFNVIKLCVSHSFERVLRIVILCQINLINIVLFLNKSHK